jgi:hypothetical protein
LERDIHHNRQQVLRIKVSTHKSGNETLEKHFQQNIGTWRAEAERHKSSASQLRRDADSVAML